MTNTNKIPNIVQPIYVDDQIDLKRLTSDVDYRRCALGRIMEGDYTEEGLKAILTVLDDIRTQEVQLTLDESTAVTLRIQLLPIIHATRSALQIEQGLILELDASDIEPLGESEARVIEFNRPPLVQKFARAA